MSDEFHLFTSTSFAYSFFLFFYRNLYYSNLSFHILNINILTKIAAYWERYFSFKQHLLSWIVFTHFFRANKQKQLLKDESSIHLFAGGKWIRKMKLSHNLEINNNPNHNNWWDLCFDKFLSAFFADLLKHQINQKILLDPMKILMAARVRQNQDLLLDRQL